MNMAPKLLFSGAILTLCTMVGCRSLPDAPSETISRSYHVTATYELEIRDETGSIIHRTNSRELSAVEHDAAVVFSEEAIMESFLKEAEEGLSRSVSNVVSQLKVLPPAPTNLPPVEVAERIEPAPRPVQITEASDVVRKKPATKSPPVESAPPAEKKTGLPDAQAIAQVQAGPKTNVAKPATPDKESVKAAAEPVQKAAKAPVAEQVAAAPAPIIATSSKKDAATDFRVRKVSGKILMASKHPQAVVGARFFVRGQPEVILDPFTGEERRISAGSVYGVAEIESIGIFGVKAKLLSGTAEKGGYLEAVEPPNGK
jgi:hypothetical protein